MSKLPDPAEAHEFFADKMNFTTGPVELNAKLGKGADINVIDVRLAKDYEEGHIPGAISIPKDQWENTDKLSKDKLNVIYCYSHVCHLAADAASRFASKGYPVMEVDGGFKMWKEHNLKTEQ